MYVMADVACCVHISKWLKASIPEDVCCTGNIGSDVHACICLQTVVIVGCATNVFQHNSQQCFWQTGPCAGA